MLNIAVIIFLCFSSTWTSSIKPRIIGGEIAQPGQFPYAVAMDIKTNAGIGFCGGTLIHDEWILTAAHCLENAVEVLIALGTTDLRNPTLLVTSSEFKRHPEYKFPLNDVALIKISQIQNFTDFIKPIDVLATQTLPTSAQVTAVGWGKTADNSSISNLLYYVNVSTISNLQCAETFGTVLLQGKLVCTEGVNHKGICQGDSGGPLIQITSEGKHNLVGVSCFTHTQGCETDDPSGFTRVFEHKMWVYETINNGGFKQNISLIALTIGLIVTFVTKY